MAFDGPGNRSGKVKEGVDVGLGKNLTEDFQAFLPAPHTGQPVMDQGDPQAF